MDSSFISDFQKLNLQNLPQVGGKNASLGEMTQRLTSKGIKVPEGFAITVTGYWKLLKENNIEQKLRQLLGELNKDYSNLRDVGAAARNLILSSHLPESLSQEILSAYKKLSNDKTSIAVAVRSSATAEDLPDASFAGQHDSYLNIQGERELLDACLKCYASLFTDRAIKYRGVNGFDHMKVGLSIGIQKMVRSDKASAGVSFTLDPETGFQNVVLITGCWGLGENIVQGTVSPDEFYVFKPSLAKNKYAIIGKRTGEKATTMVYSSQPDQPLQTIDTPVSQRSKLVLSDEEITTLAQWSVTIEEHYNKPMDIEWAKDGDDGQLYIVQARPETIHKKTKKIVKTEYLLKRKSEVITTGKGIGNRITSGIARILNSPAESDKLKEGEVLITSITSPDWDPVLKKASAIITDRGGRTSHAAIVARELGAVAIVGTNNATQLIKDGQRVTVSCAEGNTGVIYEGQLEWEEHEVSIDSEDLPHTKPMFILADPDKAFDLSFYPNAGVGLLRMEFIINNSVRVHPMALINFDKVSDDPVRQQIQALTENYANKDSYFIDKLSQGVAMVAAAFYPKDVIVRMSDFKSNEYANLLGGKYFEPKEENPMLGLRGASRYYSPLYREGFVLECKAMKRVREDMGLDNVKLMIPFCRTIEEGKKVINIMEDQGLVQGENGLELYVMAEIPSNVILAKEFAEIFDGFSIGSNDLTQLTLGLDRDSALISHLFNENDVAAKEMIGKVIRAAKESGRKIGLCGQAPSDYPEFVEFLIEQGIDSISFNPDAMVRGLENIRNAENTLHLSSHI